MKPCRRCECGIEDNEGPFCGGCDAYYDSVNEAKRDEWERKHPTQDIPFDEETVEGEYRYDRDAT